MLAPIVYIDQSEIVAGSLAELKQALARLVSSVEAEPLRYLSYDVYLSEDSSRMTVMHARPDSADTAVEPALGCHLFGWRISWT